MNPEEFEPVFPLPVSFLTKCLELIYFTAALLTGAPRWVSGGLAAARVIGQRE